MDFPKAFLWFWCVWNAAVALVIWRAAVYETDGPPSRVAGAGGWSFLLVLILTGGATLVAGLFSWWEWGFGISLLGALSVLLVPRLLLPLVPVPFALTRSIFRKIRGQPK